MNVLANVEAYKSALSAVEGHPMCFRVVYEGRRVAVLYPSGDFPVDGVRTDRTAVGLRTALAVMERHWIESFPAACVASTWYGAAVAPC